MHQVTATTADYPSLWWSNRSTCSVDMFESTEAIEEIVDAVHLAHRTAHELPPFVRHGLPQLRACSSCACDDDARSFPRFNMTGVTVTSMMRHCGELIRIAMVYLCYTDMFYIR